MTRLLPILLCLLCLAAAKRPPLPPGAHRNVKQPVKGAQALLGAKPFFAAVVPPRVYTATFAWDNAPWNGTGVTGVVIGPSPSGPWRELTNLPYTLTAQVTVQFTNEPAFFRAFNRQSQ